MSAEDPRLRASKTKTPRIPVQIPTPTQANDNDIATTSSRGSTRPRPLSHKESNIVNGSHNVNANLTDVPPGSSNKSTKRASDKSNDVPDGTKKRKKKEYVCSRLEELHAHISKRLKNGTRRNSAKAATRTITFKYEGNESLEELIDRMFVFPSSDDHSFLRTYEWLKKTGIQVSNPPIPLSLGDKEKLFHKLKENLNKAGSFNLENRMQNGNAVYSSDFNSTEDLLHILESEEGYLTKSNRGQDVDDDAASLSSDSSVEFLEEVLNTAPSLVAASNCVATNPCQHRKNNPLTATTSLAQLDADVSVPVLKSPETDGEFICVSPGPGFEDIDVQLQPELEDLGSVEHLVDLGDESQLEQYLEPDAIPLTNTAPKNRSLEESSASDDLEVSGSGKSDEDSFHSAVSQLNDTRSPLDNQTNQVATRRSDCPKGMDVDDHDTARQNSHQSGTSEIDKTDEASTVSSVITSVSASVSIESDGSDSGSDAPVAIRLRRLRETKSKSKSSQNQKKKQNQAEIETESSSSSSNGTKKSKSVVNNLKVSNKKALALTPEEILDKSLLEKYGCRPCYVSIKLLSADASTSAKASVIQPKRGRGRIPKSKEKSLPLPVPVPEVEATAGTVNDNTNADAKTDVSVAAELNVIETGSSSSGSPRKRGRPRKNPPPGENMNESKSDQPIIDIKPKRTNLSKLSNDDQVKAAEPEPEPKVIRTKTDCDPKREAPTIPVPGDEVTLTRELSSPTPTTSSDCIEEKGKNLNLQSATRSLDGGSPTRRTRIKAWRMPSPDRNKPKPLFRVGIGLLGLGLTGFLSQDVAAAATTTATPAVPLPPISMIPHINNKDNKHSQLVDTSISTTIPGPIQLQSNIAINKAVDEDVSASLSVSEILIEEEVIPQPQPKAKVKSKGSRSSSVDLALACILEDFHENENGSESIGVAHVEASIIEPSPPITHPVPIVRPALASSEPAPTLTKRKPGPKSKTKFKEEEGPSNLGNNKDATSSISAETLEKMAPPESVPDHDQDDSSDEIMIMEEIPAAIPQSSVKAIANVKKRRKTVSSSSSDDDVYVSIEDLSVPKPHNDKPKTFSGKTTKTRNVSGASRSSASSNEKRTRQDYLEEMEKAVQQSSPKFDYLVWLVEKTRNGRRKDFEELYWDIDDGLTMYPALREYKLLLQEFDQLTDEDYGGSGKRYSMIQLKKKLQDELFNALKLKKHPGQRRVRIWEKAVVEFQTSFGDQEISIDKKQVLGMICLCCHLAENSSAAKRLFYTLKDGENVNTSIINTPRLVFRESELFETNATDMWIYADTEKHIKVPNVYEGVLVIFALHFFFFIEYDAGLKTLFKDFENKARVIDSVKTLSHEFLKK